MRWQYAPYRRSVLVTDDARDPQFVAELEVGSELVQVYVAGGQGYE
jgi:hypothetical protein